MDISTGSSTRESSADGSLSDRSSAPSDVVMLPSKDIEMPTALYRKSKPSAQKAAEILHPGDNHQVPYPRELDQYVDMGNSTTVFFERNNTISSFVRYGHHVAKIEPVAGQSDIRHLYNDNRCGDIYGCTACYPTEAVVESAMGEFADRPVCIHADTKFVTKQRLSYGVYKVTFGKEVLYYCHMRRGQPLANVCGGTTIHSEQYFVVPGRGRAEVVQRLEKAVMEVRKRTLEGPIEEERVIRIYRWDHADSYWDRKMTVKGRSMDSVIVPEGVKEKIIVDLDRFFSKETAQWYQEHGLPYKRSMLFHGLPGTGKTSLITAIAAKYDRNVCFLQPHHPKFTDDAMKTCMEQVPRRAIVILEDVDALFEGRAKAGGSSCPLTFSGLLNALDGITYESGCIFVMTTNHVEKLDPALIRAGRCDLKIPFTYATDWQLDKYFLKFYPKADQESRDLFVKNVNIRFPEGVCLAETQQHFIDSMFDDAATCARRMVDYQPLPPAEKKKAEPEEDDKEKEAKEDDKESQVEASENKDESTESAESKEAETSAAGCLSVDFNL